MATNEPEDGQTSTAPPNYQISVRGFSDEESARELGQTVGAAITTIGRHINIGNLDGVTVAFDYDQALLDLDRGYETNYSLTKTTGDAVGVAMTPSVLRNGELKSHILVNACIARFISDSDHEYFSTALHILAHECAHVEVTEKFERCFPNYLLQHRHDDYVCALRWQVILACWDEYAVTRICAGIGEDPTEGYEATFLAQLSSVRAKVRNQILSYRLHGDVDRLLSELFELLGNLQKFAAYLIGNMEGFGITLEELPDTKSAISGSWFEPYFERLVDECERLFSRYGQWTSLDEFEAIADITEELLSESGVHLTALSNGKHYVDVPFTVETMPT